MTRDLWFHILVLNLLPCIGKSLILWHCGKERLLTVPGIPSKFLLYSSTSQRGTHTHLPGVGRRGHWMVMKTSCGPRCSVSTLLLIWTKRMCSPEEQKLSIFKILNITFCVKEIFAVNSLHWGISVLPTSPITDTGAVIRSSETKSQRFESQICQVLTVLRLWPLVRVSISSSVNQLSSS